MYYTSLPSSLPQPSIPPRTGIVLFVIAPPAWGWSTAVPLCPFSMDVHSARAQGWGVSPPGTGASGEQCSLEHMLGEAEAPTIGSNPGLSLSGTCRGAALKKKSREVLWPWAC